MQNILQELLLTDIEECVQVVILCLADAGFLKQAQDGSISQSGFVDLKEYC